jgi:hypothetical protein
MPYPDLRPIARDRRQIDARPRETGRQVGMKHDWGSRGSAAPVSVMAFGPNTRAIEALLTQAGTLTRNQIVRLDLLERRNPELLLAAWDHLRDRLAPEPERTWRFAARKAAWSAVREAAAAHEIEVPADDGYWRVETGIGCGAARAARFAACTLVAPEALEPEWLEILLRPWREGVGLPAGVTAS